MVYEGGRGGQNSEKNGYVVYGGYVAIFLIFLTPPPPLVDKREHFDNPPYRLREHFDNPLPPNFLPNFQKSGYDKVYVFSTF